MCGVCLLQVLIYQEFFSQGDLEKALGESPLEMMDRERACVPDLQISFLDNIAIPVYRSVSLSPSSASFFVCFCFFVCVLFLFFVCCCRVKQNAFETPQR